MSRDLRRIADLLEIDFLGNCLLSMEELNKILNVTNKKIDRVILTEKLDELNKQYKEQDNAKD